ncbi:hypothetical protein [Pseudomonas putida]
MKKSSVKTEHGQVVLLPEAVAFPDDVMLVNMVATIGRARIITAAG